MVLLSAPLLASCAEQFDATRLGVPATMASPAGEAVQGDSFIVNGKSIHAVLGIFTLAQPSLQKALEAQLAGGKAVANLTIRVRSRWSDLLISGLTLGLIIPRTVTFRGTILEAAPANP
jgi:hypothetical protein